MRSDIINFAASLVDVVGINRLSDTERLLIMGIESTGERNLDDFGHKDGKFHMYGFKKYVKPKVGLLIAFIHSTGYSAKPIGRYGYPLYGEINLKTIAISCGLGMRGKNTLVLHPQYGHRLRFIAIKTDAPIEPIEEPILVEPESPFCRNCSICIDACPVEVLEPYRVTDASICLSNLTHLTEEGRSILCDICLEVCPAGKRF
jgi:ferredoxin